MRFVTTSTENGVTPLSLAAAADYGGLNSSTNNRGSNKVKISRVSIANVGTTTQSISLFLDHLTSATFTDHYYIVQTDIPAKATLVWNQPIIINLKTHKLVMTNSGSTQKITVTIT